jgi:L-ascorbate metabolism protein UlaG (beta-lactamase superfamily)
MENGQYNKNWAYIHLLPEDLEQAMLDLQAEQYITVHHDKFSLAPHAWDEPDSVAHSIAEKDRLNLLDRPIGSVIYY